MPTSYTSLLGLALPVTGELSGTWGDVVNNYITGYIDASVAGTQTISGSQTAVTLSTTNGTSLSQAGSGGTGSAQYQIINCTGNPAGLLTITAPAASKSYIVINSTSTSQSVKIVGAGPTTGVTLVAGEKAIVAWNGSDFVKVASSVADGVTTIDFGTTGLTPNTATSGAVTVAGTLSVANGGTGQTTYTNGQLLIGNTTGNTLAKSTLTAGSGVTITNGAGTITISATGSGGDAVLSANNAFTGANTFYNSSGQVFGTGTSTQDGIILAGRAGGSSSYRVTLQPGTLSASRSVTLPDANTTIPVATQVLTFSGPSAARTLTLPDENFSVGFRNLPAVGTKTGSYTLAVGDVGKYVQLGSGGSITIPTSTFAEGDAITLYNNTTGNITITCSAPTAYIAGTNTVKTSMTLATRGVATILFYSATACVVSGNVT